MALGDVEATHDELMADLRARLEGRNGPTTLLPGSPETPGTILGAMDMPERKALRYDKAWHLSVVDGLAGRGLRRRATLLATIRGLNMRWQSPKSAAGGLNN